MVQSTFFIVAIGVAVRVKMMRYGNVGMVRLGGEPRGIVRNQRWA